MRPNRRVCLRHSSQEGGRHRLRRKRGDVLPQGLETGGEAATRRRVGISCLGSIIAICGRERGRRDKSFCCTVVPRRGDDTVRVTKTRFEATKLSSRARQPASAPGQGAHPAQQKLTAVCDCCRELRRFLVIRRRVLTHPDGMPDRSAIRCEALPTKPQCASPQYINTEKTPRACRIQSRTPTPGKEDLQGSS